MKTLSEKINPMRMPSGRWVNHYRVLGVDREASSELLREAFRKRLLALHPDKVSTFSDPQALDAVMCAWEILGNPHRREEYDRLERIRHTIIEKKSELKHVTESERPVDQARAVLYLLLERKSDDAIRRLEAMGDGREFLVLHLEIEEAIDAAFLIGEVYERRDRLFEALAWYQTVLQWEEPRRHPRPWFTETQERCKKLLIHKISPTLEPRVALEYLHRAEIFTLDRGERFELMKRRAQCYLDLGMKVEAGRHLKSALELMPAAKGVGRLKTDLTGYYEE